jgi:hypothetical protein
MKKNAASSVLKETSRRPERFRWLTRFLPIALVLGLVSGGLGAALDALPAAAGTIQNSTVSFSGVSQVTGATTTWTVGFTTDTGTLIAGDVINVTFPSTFTVPSGTVVLGSAFATASCTLGSDTASGETVTIHLAGASCSIVAGTALRLTIADVTNGAAGSYTTGYFEVSTSNDGDGSPTADVVIYPATTSVSDVNFSGSSYSAGATGTTWTVDFTTSDPNGNLVAGDDILVTFPAGFSIPTSPEVQLEGFSGCSTTSVISSSFDEQVTIELPSGCTLAASTSAAVEIEGITNPTAGTYDNTLFSVSTSADTTPASAVSDVVIGSGGGVTPPADTLSGVSFSGSSMSGGATNTTWTVGFTTSDPDGELGPADVISVTFPAGFSIPSNPAVTLGSGFYDCTATPQATAVVSGETVLITLGAGCELNASTAATVTIAGITNPAAGTYTNTSFLVSTSADFAASPAANVVITGGSVTSCAGSTGNAAFLCLAYEDLLGRAPDAGGLASFEGLLAAGVSRQQVAYDIATSPEHFTDLVVGDYAYFLHRAADPAGLASWVGVLEAGWSPQAVLEGILGSAEFYGDAGGTPSGFVSALYTDLLGRAADSGGLATWVGQLNAGVSRGAVVAGILYSNEYETNFVKDLYFYLLDRAADPGGLATWVGELAHGVSEEWVISGIVGSPEFYGLSQYLG